MKSMIASLAFLAFTSIGHAGFPPKTSCSNLGGTIEISDRGVSILTGTTQTAENLKINNYVKFSSDELNLVEQDVQQMPAEKFGCTLRTVTFKQIAMTKKDGSILPDAYNRLVQNGVLSDYFVCATSLAWMPPPGQSCR